MTTKHISIRPDQTEWLNNNDKSLSKYVQRKIDEDMGRKSNDNQE